MADVDVVMDGNRRLRARAGITTHRTATLDPADVRDLDGLPVTAPARTLIDLASVAHPFLDALYSEPPRRDGCSGRATSRLRSIGPGGGEGRRSSAR